MNRFRFTTIILSVAASVALASNGQAEPTRKETDSQMKLVAKPGPSQIPNRYAMSCALLRNREDANGTVYLTNKGPGIAKKGQSIRVEYTMVISGEGSGLAHQNYVLPRTLYPGQRYLVTDSASQYLTFCKVV